MSSPCADTGAEVAPSWANPCWGALAGGPGALPTVLWLCSSLGQCPRAELALCDSSCCADHCGAWSLHTRREIWQRPGVKTTNTYSPPIHTLTPINAQIPHLCGSFAVGWKVIMNSFLFSAPQDCSFPPVFSTIALIHQRLEQAVAAISQVRTVSGCTGA